jgi:DNA-binding FrmR family transcriptional regulator
MIETDRESHAILTQLAALRAALDSVGSLVISDHIETLANSSGLGPDSRSALKSMIEIFLR